MLKREIRIIRGREGFGFTLSGHAPCVVTWISDTSYAKDAGLRIGDCIVTINKEDVLHARHEDVVKAIGLSSGVLIMEVADDITISSSSREEDDSEVFSNNITSNSWNNNSVSSKHNNSDSKFYRTKRVLNELKNGSLFQDVVVALDSSPVPKDKISRTGTAPRLKMRSSWSSNENFVDSTLPRSNTAKKGHRKKAEPFSLQVVVSYLATTSEPVDGPDDVQGVCVRALQSSIRQLRAEQDIHRRVLLKVTSKCLEVFNADKELLVLLDSDRPCVCSTCDEDERFFSIATLHNNNLVECYQFMVNSTLHQHQFHVEHARRFGIVCTNDRGGCLEFPDSPVTLVHSIQALFGGNYSELEHILFASDGSYHGDSDKSGGDPKKKDGKRYEGASYGRKAKNLVSKLNRKNLSKSSESVRAPDMDSISATSSFESLNEGLEGFESNVQSWSESFEKLLDDPIGLHYFTEYLRKEFSEENITFYTECEKLKNTNPADVATLAKLSHGIYDGFLSSDASCPVNIDSKAQRLADDAIDNPPHPGMFSAQQNQIYKLMEMDSYRRFLKSKIYAQCRRIHNNTLTTSANNESPLKNSNERSRHGFSFQSRKFFQRKPKKSRSITEIGKDFLDSDSASVMSSRSEDDILSSRRMSDAQLCQLVFWDGSSTVLPVQEGKVTIRQALEPFCDKQNVPVSAVDVYNQDEDRALSLDQDIIHLAGQVARVERRTLFKLDLHPIGRTIGVKAKPSKSTIDVLKPVMAKYGLDFEQTTVRVAGEMNVIDLNQPVSDLDGLRVTVDHKFSTTMPRKSKSKYRDERDNQKSHSAASSDTEDLILAMSAAASSKMDDQRGLISQIDLEMPDFLKLPPAKSESNAKPNDAPPSKEKSKRYKR